MKKPMPVRTRQARATSRVMPTGWRRKRTNRAFLGTRTRFPLRRVAFRFDCLLGEVPSSTTFIVVSLLSNGHNGPFGLCPLLSYGHNGPFGLCPLLSYGHNGPFGLCAPFRIAGNCVYGRSGLIQ